MCKGNAGADMWTVPGKIWHAIRRTLYSVPEDIVCSVSDCWRNLGLLRLLYCILLFPPSTALPGRERAGDRTRKGTKCVSMHVRSLRGVEFAVVFKSSSGQGSVDAIRVYQRTISIAVRGILAQ